MNKKVKFIHPAFDIQDEILFLGFQFREYDNESKKWEIKNRFLTATFNEHTNNVDVQIVDENEIEVNNILYLPDISYGSKNRYLPKIDSRWSVEMFTKSKFENKVNPQDIFNRILSQLKAYMTLEEESDYYIVTAWIIMTYFFPIFRAIPFLNVKGMKGTGKTTFLDFLRLLSFNAFKERSTLATFRDKTDSERATALIDQADNKFGTDERKISDMLDPIVDSYKSTSGVMSKSVQKGKNFERVEYDIFSPKVFASIKDLNFDLKDRCIQIQLVKSTENKPQLDSDKQIWFEMRNELYKMLILYFKSVKNISIETEAKYLESKTLFGRPKELWLPIETILKLCNLNESEITKILNSYIQKIAITEDSLNELESEVIKFIWKQFVVEEEKWIPLKDIANDPTVIEMFDDEKILSLKSRTNIIGGLLKRLNIYNDRKRKNGGYIHFYTKDRVQKFLKAYSVVEDSDSQYSQFAEIPVDSSEF